MVAYLSSLICYFRTNVRRKLVVLVKSVVGLHTLVWRTLLLAIPFVEITLLVLLLCCMIHYDFIKGDYVARDVYGNIL